MIDPQRKDTHTSHKSTQKTFANKGWKHMCYSPSFPTDHAMEPLVPSPRRHKFLGLLTILFTLLFLSSLALQEHFSRTREIDEAKRNLMLLRTTLPHQGDTHHILSKASNPTLVKNALRTLIPSQFSDTSKHFLAVLDHDGTLVAALPEDFNTHTFLTSYTLIETALYTPVIFQTEHSFGRGQSVVLVAKSLIPSGRTLVMGQIFHDGLISWNKTSSADLIIPFICALLISGLAASLLSLHFQKRSTEQAFTRLSNYMNVAFTRGRCGWWDWDVTRGRIYWSNAIYTLLGFERERTFLSFGEFKELIHPEDLDIFALATQLASKEVLSIDHDFRIQNAHGQWIWVRAHAELVEEQKLGELHLIGILSDTSEHHSEAEKQATADKRLLEALEEISESFVLWDADKNIVIANSKFQEIENIRSEVVSYQLQEDSSSSENASMNGEELGASFEVAFSDGKWLQINERPTKDGGYVSIGTDITLLKQHEERLRASEKQLVDTISDLKQSRQALEAQTRQLSELAEKYLDQKAEAESANRAKSEFLANMSHEFRTPLNAILGFTQVMTDSIFGPLGHEKYSEYCRDIHRSGEYLLQVVNDILDMARLESGRIHLEKSEVAIDVLVQAALTHAAETAPGKMLTFTADVPLDTKIFADARALQKILEHVICNAIKFSTTGGHITVRVRRLRTAINIYVEDNGIGINANSLKRLGQPFEHGWGEFDKTYRGPGLGLAVAKSLAELHGGSLRIRSLSGSGTVVLIHLPNYEAGRSTAGLKLMAASRG